MVRRTGMCWVGMGADEGVSEDVWTVWFGISAGESALYPVEKETVGRYLCMYVIILL